MISFRCSGKVHKWSLLAFLTTFLSAASAQTSCDKNPYWIGVDTTDSAAVHLHLNSTHQGIPYTSTDADVWDALVHIHQVQDGTDDFIRLFYTGIIHDDTTEQADSYNREHLWPRQKGVEYDGRDFSDIHAIVPAYWTNKQNRVDRYFASCGIANSEAECNRPTGTFNIGTEYDSTTYAPATNKGDIARAIFYMVVRYDGTESDTTDLQLTDCPTGATGEYGYLSQLLQWHMDDPVDQEEQDRNYRACEKQGNRNPFIDIPSLVHTFFGYPRTLTAEGQGYDCSQPNPTTPPPPDTAAPSVSSSEVPSSSPSVYHSQEPSSSPSALPSSSPSVYHSATPSEEPSNSPSALHSTNPSSSPSVAASAVPTKTPENVPTATPTTGAPTLSSSNSPSKSHSMEPSLLPSSSPTTAEPSSSPSVVHSTSPSVEPSLLPSSSPTTAEPSSSPSVVHSTSPSVEPSLLPSSSPTTAEPSSSPSKMPTKSPSDKPSLLPSSSPSVSSGPDLIDFTDFESGWNEWKDGGTDVRLSEKDAAYCNSGSFCPRLRDNSGVQSSIYKNFGDLTSYNELMVDFSFYPDSMEKNEDFFLEISGDNDDWYLIENWASGTDFTNKQRMNPSVSISSSDLTDGFYDTTYLRFRCDASGNGDKIYIDDIKVAGTK